MWRWGFAMWRTWVWLRLLVPLGLLVWLGWHVWGTGARLGALILVVLGVLGGAGFVLSDFSRHELGTRPRRPGRR